VYNHPIDYLYLSISLGMEGSRFGQFSVHHGPKENKKVVRNMSLSKTMVFGNPK
jgi:hypothetical protein